MKQDIRLAKKIAAAVAQKGGRVYFVGGFVRDRLLGTVSKDIDIEVHGISAETLVSILSEFGTPITVGKSFGVYNVRGYTLDVAMPRKETATGHGHKDFAVDVDPWIGTLAAAKRRDFTIGALMQDVLTDELIDHFGGRQDLAAGILRHVDESSFPEDPLRVLRAARFAARFGFAIAPETVRLCSGMELSALSGQRVAEELHGALMDAQRPSLFFNSLRQMDQLKPWFVEAAALIGIPQSPVYHGEGDVWNHTMMVLDHAAALRREATYPYYLMLGALVHDFGKATTTAEKDGILHAYDHENAGLPAVRRFLSRLTNHKELTDHVLNLCALHMQPCAMAARNNSVKTTNRMFDRSRCPEDLMLLALADNAGRITQYPTDPRPFLEQRLQDYRRTMAEPYVTGQDLIEAGLTPDKHFSDVLQYAHKLRLARVGKTEALKQTLAYARKVTKL